MISRLVSLFMILGTVVFSIATNSHAANVKDLILDEVDPGRVNGTAASYYDELTPELQAQFMANFDAGEGYYLTPTANVTWTANGVRYAKASRIFLVAVDGGNVVVPMAVSCTHSGCNNSCTVTGCGPTTSGNKPACSGASCTGEVGCGIQNPNCSKTESLGAAYFSVFGAI